MSTFITKLLAPFFRTPEGGADTAVYLTSSPDVATTTGAYFVNRKAIRSSRLSYDDATRELLWAVSEDLTGVRW